MFLPSLGSPPPVRASRQHLHRAKNTNARIPAGIVPLLIIGLMPAALHAQDAGVVVARVVNREVNTGHRVVGSVMPIQSSTVGTAVDGRVLEFLVNTGDAVKARQPLAKLRTGTLEIELAASQAELKLRKEELRQLKNGARPEDISEARARMLAAKANHKNSLTHLNRLKQLFERQATNQTDLDDAAERSEAASQNLLALQAAFGRIEAGPREEEIAQATARVELQQANVELIEDRIKKYIIYAPFDGYVTAEHTEVGEWVSNADPIADVIALDHVEIVCNVPAEQAVRLQQNKDVRIEFPELPGDVFTGQISQIVPIADSRTRTFPVNIRLKNTTRDGRPVLMAGMLARAILPTGNRTVMPLVPKDALVLNGSRRYVFVATPDGNAERAASVRSVPVTLGIADEGLIQVSGELKAGDLVVVRGNERLKDGQQVVLNLAETTSVSVGD
ncbi:Multidrug resistance protein MdtN [Fuerstiella marisgermanici]|uniref:Multidrug resistance protein MdtN n=2 Tax=Fuerstiella marisgermanici TaxID=1891926 RepID=A0A1P8WPN1_9PLAN|nr:Multidrug resistance protein MdtN [Fuerstiella marisgermanici]